MNIPTLQHNHTTEIPMCRKTHTFVSVMLLNVLIKGVGFFLSESISCFLRNLFEGKLLKDFFANNKKHTQSSCMFLETVCRMYERVCTKYCCDTFLYNFFAISGWGNGKQHVIYSTSNDAMRIFQEKTRNSSDFSF